MCLLFVLCFYCMVLQSFVDMGHTSPPIKFLEEHCNTANICAVTIISVSQNMWSKLRNLRCLFFVCMFFLKSWNTLFSVQRKQGPVVQNLMKLLANVMLKFLSWNMANTLIFFAEKKWVVFAVQKLLTFLQQKYQYIWKYLSYNS